MNPLRWLKRLFAKDDSSNDPFSIVLLMRKPVLFTSAQIGEIGECEFHKRFDGEEDPMYYVTQTGAVILLKVGKYFITILHSAEPYLGAVEEIAPQLPQPEQQNAWREHCASVALDLQNKDVSKNDAYAMLARFAVQLGDDRCAGIYLPKEDVMLPNDGAAEEGLRQLIRKEMFR